MSDPFGFTRNIVRHRYALLTPSGFVPSYLPGWQKAVCHVLISPSMGARFSQLLITLDSDGQCMAIGSHLGPGYSQIACRGGEITSRRSG